MAKIQFNCRLEEDVAAWVAAESERESAERGTRFSQADVIALLVNRASVGLPAKLSKRAKVIESRKAADPLAQRLGRDDIDYATDELPSGGSVGVSLDVVAPLTGSQTGKASMETWRAGRKPIPKPSQRK